MTTSTATTSPNSPSVSTSTPSAASAPAAAPAYPDTQLLIANIWQDAEGGRRRDVLNPATGARIGSVAEAGTPDLDRALAAAEAGFRAWRGTTALERSNLMRKAAGLVRERAGAIASLLTLEQGKPLAEAKAEVMAAADITEWFAEEARRVYGRIVPSRNLKADQMVLKEPVGPVAAFTPWNFPVNQIIRKLGGALAAGCSFLVKAPEETPASPAALIRCFVDAGLPPGVVGLVYGDPATVSSYLIASPVIRKITFTGSTAVGKQLAELAGRHMKRATMELGGHAPVIVCDDADIELAARATAAGKFRNAGQVCIAPTRFLVHAAVKGDFVEALTARTKALALGDGLAEGTTLGPLANARRLEAIGRVVQDARERGAKVLTGGERVGNAGNFYAPTILDDVPLQASVFNDEPFGPVAAVRTFDDLGDAIAEANRLPYGLAAYAFTRSLRNAHQLAHDIESGMVWINQPAAPVAELPFGGVKDSGYGSEGGPEAVEAYLNTKHVSIMAV